MKVTKKIIALFILGLSIVGITNAVFEQNGDYYVGDAGQSIINGNYTYNIDNKANFNTEIGNDSTKSFYWNVANAYGNGSFIYNISWYDGKLYFLTSLDGTTQVQGFIQNICIKPVSSRGNEFLHNDCTYNESIDTLNSINTLDGYAFELVGQINPGFSNGTPMQFCFSDGTNDYCLQCGFMNNECASGLSGTLNITNTNFNNIKDINWSNSPIRGGNSSGTGETGTGTLKYCPSIKHEITMYGYKYNTGLCYSNTEEISGGQVITVTPISIFDAFPTYQAYVQAYNLVTNNCHTSTVNTVEQCQTALQTIGKKPSQILLKLINSNIQEGISLSKIYQYCHLQLDYTEEEKWSKSTCDLKEDDEYYATGVNQNSESNPNPLQGMTDVLQNSNDIIIPDDGTIFDSILPDGILSWKDVVFDFNFWKNLTTLISKMIVLFKVRPIQTGILPPLITSLLLLIILFKIYKK